VYHPNVAPEPPMYDKVVELPAQILVDVADTEVGATGKGFTVIVTV
jgi:hypothetical protein